MTRLRILTRDEEQALVVAENRWRALGYDVDADRAALAQLFRAADDRGDRPAGLVLWGASLAFWAVLAAIVAFGAVTGVAALLSALLGLGMVTSLVVGFAACGVFAAWTGWLATVVGRR